MDWGSIIGPALVAALVSGGISIVGLIVSTRTARTIHTEKLAFDRDLAERQFVFDKEMAERKFRLDRELHDHKRKVELAETILAEFRQMAKIIGAIRSPMAFAGEGTDRPRGENESEEQIREKNTYFVPQARLAKYSDFIFGFESKRFRSGAVLGEGTDEAFEAIREVLIKVQVSSNSLLRMVDAGPQVRQANPELWNLCEQAIWEDLADEDPLKAKVNRAIEIVEAICRPILRGEWVV